MVWPCLSLRSAPDLSLERMFRYGLSMPDLRAAVRAQLQRFELEDEALVKAWAGMTECRKFARGQILLQAGDTPRQFFLVLEGVGRQYYTTYQGRERNKAFFCEGGVLGSISAILTRGSAPFSVDVIEDSLLAVTPVEPFLALASRLPTIEILLHRFTSYILIRDEQREAILLTGDMEARYRWVMEYEPWLLERVPQYQVASYLGMDPVSLSRLKQGKSR